MKIISIKTEIKDLALLKPYTISYKTVTKVENVFMLITLENGMVGVGAANPDIQVTGEGPQKTLQNCNSDFFHKVIGRDIRHFQQLIFECKKAFPHQPGTLALFDIALHDAFGRFMDIPVVDFYGRKHLSLPTSVTIGIMNVSETLAQAKEYALLGFKVLKIKTGENAEIDAERVIKVRQQFPKMKLRVDANQGYSAVDLSRFSKLIEGYDLELIEQPIKVGFENILDSFPSSTRQKLVADESLKDVKAAIKLASHPQKFGIYNIKFMKCGGVLGAKAIATVAENANIDLFWGCNDESIVSITAALHTAFSCPNTKFLDLDGSLDLAEDMVKGGFILDQGMMRISKKPGFGYEMI